MLYFSFLHVAGDVMLMIRWQNSGKNQNTMKELVEGIVEFITIVHDVGVKADGTTESELEFQEMCSQFTE